MANHKTVNAADIQVPVYVAAEGSPAVAAFLRTHGYSNNEVADAVNLGSRTVSQYINDFRKGKG
jgi:hypothetical protein